MPDAILQKAGKLTDEEFAKMKEHPVAGFNILSGLKMLTDELVIVRSHHERYDGKGYPDRKKGDELPMFAWIVSAADAIDAMTSDRPYRKASSLEVAVEQVRAGAGTHFHPDVAEAVLDAAHNGTPEGDPAGEPLQGRAGDRSFRKPDGLDQRACASATRCLAGLPSTTHLPDAFSSGSMVRTVTPPASALIFISHSASPHQGTHTKPEPLLEMRDDLGERRHLASVLFQEALRPLEQRLLKGGQLVREPRADARHRHRDGAGATACRPARPGPRRRRDRPR